MNLSSFTMAKLPYKLSTVDKTKYSFPPSHRRNTTILLETNALIYIPGIGQDYKMCFHTFKPRVSVCVSFTD